MQYQNFAITVRSDISDVKIHHDLLKSYRMVAPNKAQGETLGPKDMVVLIYPDANLFARGIYIYKKKTKTHCF